jgi:hypothetical protein
MKSQLKAVICLFEKLYNMRESSLGDDALDEELAAGSLFRLSTFRLPAVSNQKVFIGFSLMYAVVRRSIRSFNNPKNFETAEGIIISSSSCDHSNAQHYISSMSGKRNLAYIIKDNLSFRGEFTWREWCMWFIFATKQAIRSLTNSKRSNIALSIVEVLEISLILKWLKRHNLKEIYDFVPFEVDSNAMFLCTRELGVHTTKIPSPGPLASHNKIILCNALVLSSRYQFEELEQLRCNQRVGNYTSWPPERAHTYYNLYTKEVGSTSPRTIGFYSHGEWIRKKMGLIHGSSSLLQAEEDTLRFLGRFLSENPDFYLTIYPHPKERKNYSIDELRAYYSYITGVSTVQIADSTQGTAFRFRESDIAITCYSTIIFERLYCGFKTLIKRIKEHDFPLGGSPLNRICFEDYQQLSALIKDASQIDNTSFFEKHGISSYTHYHFPTPISRNE